MNTGLFDKNGAPINIGDRTRLVLDDGEVREFDVCFKTVQRTRVKTLEGFTPETTDISITGIFFCWEGHDFLPCVDENGISDVEKMEVITASRQYEMTNADRIREMSSSELAEIIMCPYNLDLHRCSNREDCLKCCVKWLESKAEEENK